jgi:hypothetical protein
MPFVSSRQPDHPGPDGAGPPGDPVHRPGPAPRGRADRGGPGRDRGRAASPVLPAHARGYQAARRRGGPAAGSCQRRADPAEPVRKAFHAVPGHRLTAAQVSQLNTPFITLSVVSDLVPVALWLWMARASGQGRNWARSLSTALFGLATLDLTGAFRTPVIRLEIVPMLFGPAVPWLAGAAAVWQLWRRPLPPSSSRMVTRGCHQNGHGHQGGPRAGSDRPDPAVFAQVKAEREDHGAGDRGRSRAARPSRRSRCPWTPCTPAAEASQCRVVNASPGVSSSWRGRVLMPRIALEPGRRSHAPPSPHPHRSG